MESSHLFIVRAVRVAFVAGLGAAAPCAHGQLVPVSRWSHLSSHYFSSSSPSEDYDQQFTDWATGSVTLGSAYESVTLQSGSIQITSRASGHLVQGGIHNPTSFGSYSSVESVFIFDIAAASAYTLNGSLFIGFSASSVELTRAGQAAPVYSFASAPPWGSHPYSTQGTLAPGRYTLRVSVVATAMEPGPMAQASVNLIVVPGPAAAGALVCAVALTGSVRRRR